MELTLRSQDVEVLSEVLIDAEWMVQWPLCAYEGPVDLVHEASHAQEVLREVQAAETKVWGFDTETRPAFRKGESFLPSLLQLATTDRVYLFQLQRIGGLEAFVELFEDASIIKAGVALRDDLKDLQKMHSFEPAGFVDLGHMSTKLGLRYTGLRNLMALLYGRRVGKGMQVSNWAATCLNEKQIRYAATDAWASLWVYRGLEMLSA